jgi:pyrroline-5-carboxylate reductase
MILKNPGEPLSAMLEELATPGGITELGLRDLESARALEAWPAAAEKVLARLRGET